MGTEFIPVKSMVDLTEEYLAKRVSVKLVTGEVVTGIVRWREEDDSQTGIEGDWGFVLDNAVLNGIPLGHSTTIPDSRIAAYRPLEPANTREEMIAMGL